jgi:3-isopropylmalate/(R)-2-methylmalate dehydratase small subunit
MSLEMIKRVTGRAVHVPGDDIDTDRVIPARFMKCVTFEGLGQYLFHDVRFHADGSPTAHPLNDPRFAGATILVSHRNFGCGSSREHAPQAIAKHGFRAIIAESFAEIFAGNATTLGMPCVALAKAEIDEIAALIEASPETAIEIDLEAAEVRTRGKAHRFAMKPGTREALVAGQWDPLAALLDAAPRAREVAAALIQGVNE